jgi:large subunit ribosomal protein L10
MRPEKNLIVDEVKQRLNNSPFVLLTDYTGMNIDHFNELRNRLSAQKSEYRVVKNTLLKRALRDLELPALNGNLSGQTAVVLGEKDVTGAAKVLKNFAKEFSKPVIKLGIVDRVLVSKDELMALADLPSREVLLSQLLGLINEPATRLARLIRTPAGQIAQVIRANSEKGQSS